LYLLAGVVLVGLAVETEESTKIELGCLEELDLSDVDLCQISLVLSLLYSRVLNIRSGEGRCPGWPSRSRDR